MSASDYFEDVALDALFDVAGYYLLVSTADPTDDGSGLAEPSGNNYARVSVANSDWNAASGGNKDNVTAFSFPQASGSWGTLTHWALADAATNGNLIIIGTMTASKSIVSGQTLSFPAGSIVISLD